MIEKLTRKELLGYFDVYRSAFPDWRVEHGVVLTRNLGPVTQRIDFQALRGGAYRPGCSTLVAGPPDGAQILYRFLNHPMEQVTRQQHETKWRSVIRAMEEQFVPNVRRDLDLVEVLTLADEEVDRDGIENLRYLSGVAALSAHLGRLEEAVKWCDRIEADYAALGRDPAEWELNQARFARRLREAIQSDRYVEFLSRSVR